MKLFEFNAHNAGWQDLEDDNSQPKWGESRKTKLTLGEINKIRKMREVLAYEHAADLKKIRKMYNVQPQQGM